MLSNEKERLSAPFLLLRDPPSAGLTGGNQVDLLRRVFQQ